MNVTQNTYSVFSEQGILVNKVNFTELQQAYGVPV